MKRRIHEIAKRLGIDRRTIAPLAAQEFGHGGVPCSICEDLALTAGLRFVEINNVSESGLEKAPQCLE